jgi:hypothetical protein
MVLTYNVLNVTSTTILATNYDTVFVNNSGGSIIINLPLITSDGQRYLIKRIDNNEDLVLLVPNGSDRIGNNSSQSLGNYQVIEIVSSGSNWEYVNNVYP